MTADEAQRLVARCLVDPDYLDAARSEFPSGSGRAGSSDDDISVRLRLFRGFIMRIKHTQLRRIVPLTLRLLAMHAADIAFFAEAAPGYLRARQEGPLPIQELLTRFERALAQRLQVVEPGARAEIEAVLRHEGRIWRTPRGANGPGATAHPRLVPGASVEVYGFDVLGFCAALARDPFTLPDARTATQALLYCPDGSATRIVEIDGLSAWVLSRLDGAASLAALDVALSQGLGLKTGDAVVDIVADAIARGFAECATLATAA